MRLIKRHHGQQWDTQRSIKLVSSLETVESVSTVGHSNPLDAARPERLPKAGSTTIKIENVGDSCLDADGIEKPAWRIVPSSEFYTRSLGYSKTKEKVPSPGSIYDCAQVDIFESESSYSQMAVRVELPLVEGIIEKGNWFSPDIFVISISIPTEIPSGRKDHSQRGLTIVMYFTMKKETRRILQLSTMSKDDPEMTTILENIDEQLVNGVRLWEKWCQRSPHDPKFQARFKLTPKINNLSELGFPNWIKRHVRPVLIKRSGVTGCFHRYPELNAVEFHVNLHPFPNLFKRAMSFLRRSYFPSIVGCLGFVIEGRCDDELPEVVIGLAQLSNVNPDILFQENDMFAPRVRG